MSVLASHLKIPLAVLFVVTIVAQAAHYLGPAPRYYPPHEGRRVAQLASQPADDQRDPPIRFTEATVQLALEP